MKKVAIGFVVSTFLLGAFLACSNGGSGSSATATTNSYQGAGSKWSASIGDSTFTLTKYASASASAAVELTISGSVQRNTTSKFLQLTVSSATGTGAPAAGSLAYGLEIPGTAFFLKPMGAASEPIIMVATGTCPSSTFNANWILAKPKSTFTAPLTATMDVFGGAAMTFNGASSSLLVSQYQPITGAALTSGGGNGNGTSTLSFDIANCSDGLMRVADGADFFDMYFTQSNNVLVKFPSGSGNQIIFGSARQTAAVTQADLAGTYSAIVFQDKSSGDSIFPAELTMPASGNATGLAITDVVSNTLDTSGIVMSGIATVTDATATQLPSGFFRASLNPTAGAATNGKVTCAYSTSSTTKVLACSGYMDDAGGDARRPFFFLGRSR